MAYFANSSESSVLDDQCGDCPLGAGWNDPAQGRLSDSEDSMRTCPVALVHLTFNRDQLGNDKLRYCLSSLVRNDGECQIRKALLTTRPA